MCDNGRAGARPSRLGPLRALGLTCALGPARAVPSSTGNPVTLIDMTAAETLIHPRLERWYHVRRCGPKGYLWTKGLFVNPRAFKNRFFDGEQGWNHGQLYFVITWMWFGWGTHNG